MKSYDKLDARTQDLNGEKRRRSLQHTSEPEEVGHGLKGIMVCRISESRTLFYRGHEINIAGFSEEVSINIDHFDLLLFGFAISIPRDKLKLVVG